MGVVWKEKDFLQFKLKDWSVFQQTNGVNRVVKLNLIVMLALIMLCVSLGINATGAHAQNYVAHQTTQKAQVAHTNQAANNPPTGSYNWFPYPWCTWWADQRFQEMRGVYVPWRTQSDAWEWTARAYQFGWHVSSQPTVGAIINLQPWVQGAYGLGHVGVVERVYSDGSVLASNSSWGANPYVVVYWHFYQGPGVTFITW